MLGAVRAHVLDQITENAVGLEVLLIDDMGFPKQSKHSVGMARQFCGQVGKQDNCQVAVSDSVANGHYSLPLGLRLYLPEAWAKDASRRREVKVPEAVRFATKRVTADLIN